MAKAAALPRAVMELEEAEGKTASVLKARPGRPVSAPALPADAQARREAEARSAAARPERPAYRHPAAVVTAGRPEHGRQPQYGTPRPARRPPLGVRAGDPAPPAAAVDAEPRAPSRRDLRPVEGDAASAEAQDRRRSPATRGRAKARPRPSRVRSETASERAPISPPRVDAPQQSY